VNAVPIRERLEITIHRFTLSRSKPWQAKSDARKLRYLNCLLLAVISLTDGPDLPISIYEADELDEPIIVDDNSDQPIFIDGSDDEMDLDDDNSS